MNADIICAIRKYVHATGDEIFLNEYGAEMLIETARLGSNPGFFSEDKKGKPGIHDVTDPDEYNTVINNNTYTNLMAREKLLYAASTIESLREKKPDVCAVLAMFLFGQAFSPEQKKRSFDDYDPLTPGDSSLSSCIQSIVAAEIGYPDLALEYARAAMLMDLADVGGNVKDRCHIASIGGTWIVMVYGIDGMRDFDETLAFKPCRLPDQPSKIRFPLTYRGQILDVEMGPEGARYSLREGEGLMIRHEDEEILLSPQAPVAIRQIVTWQPS
jgi:trehalose/maltose hydrolase-like predicted phosphorylase